MYAQKDKHPGKRSSVTQVDRVWFAAGVSAVSCCKPCMCSVQVARQLCVLRMCVCGTLCSTLLGNNCALAALVFFIVCLLCRHLLSEQA